MTDKIDLAVDRIIKGIEQIGPSAQRIAVDTAHLMIISEIIYFVGALFCFVVSLYSMNWFLNQITNEKEDFDIFVMILTPILIISGVITILNFGTMMYGIVSVFILNKPEAYLILEKIL